MQTEPEHDRPDERSPPQPPAEERPSEHSGQGARSALAKMKLWERSRAQLNSGKAPDDKPQAQ